MRECKNLHNRPNRHRVRVAWNKYQNHAISSLQVISILSFIGFIPNGKNSKRAILRTRQGCSVLKCYIKKMKVIRKFNKNIINKSQVVLNNSTRTWIINCNKNIYKYICMYIYAQELTATRNSERHSSQMMHIITGYTSCTTI